MRATWIAVITLCAIGVIAGIARALFISDLGAHAEPARTEGFRVMGIEEPHPARRAADVADADRGFAAFPLTTLAHVIPGALFLGLAPLQFWAGFRNRHRNLHRWSGRLLVVLGMVIAPAGIFFAVWRPFGGFMESLIVVAMGAWFLVSLVRGFLSARKGEIERHRRWMIRAFAMGLAISVMRVISLPLDIMLAPAGVGPRQIFIVMLGTGFVMMVVASEMWIAYAGRASSASLQISTR
jgi:uncharacterized membrane protein